MEELIIKRANELWEAGACMGSGWDADNPMTTLNEAIVFFLMEDEVLSEEVSGEDLFEALNDSRRNYKIAIIGHGTASGEVAARIARDVEKLSHKDILVLPATPEPDFSEVKNSLNSMIIKARPDFVEPIIIPDLNADAKAGTNPRGRKAGNSKKRRKH